MFISPGAAVAGAVSNAAAARITEFRFNSDILLCDVGNNCGEVARMRQNEVASRFGLTRETTYHDFPPCVPNGLNAPAFLGNARETLQKLLGGQTVFFGCAK